jgi:hypothetical protein
MLLKRFVLPIGFPAGCSGSRDARFAAVVKAARKRWTEVRKQAKKVERQLTYPLQQFLLLVDPVDQRTRVMSCTQLVSQVLPSSGESACSQWHDVGVMLDQMKRARTRFPLTVSSP